MQAEACNFIKKETLTQVFSCEFCELSRNTFLQNTSKRLLLESQIWISLNRPQISRIQGSLETFNTWINFSDTGINLWSERVVVPLKLLLRSNYSPIIFWQRFVVSSFSPHLYCTWLRISSVITAFFLTLWERLFDIEPTSITYLMVSWRLQNQWIWG